MVISANPPKSGWDKEMRKFSNKLEVNSKLLQICQKQDQEGKPFSCLFFFFFPSPLSNSYMPTFYFMQVHNQQEPGTKGWKGSEPPKWSRVKENTNMTIFPFVFGHELFLQGRS